MMTGVLAGMAGELVLGEPMWDRGSLQLQHRERLCVLHGRSRTRLATC